LVLAISMLTCGLGPAASAQPAEKSACVQAGDRCVENIGDVARCRAAQASCEAMSVAINPPGSVLSTGRPIDIPPLPDPLPLSPQDEQAWKADDPEAMICEAQARNLVEAILHGRIDRVRVTRHARWGTIWRADISTPMIGGEYKQRLVCGDHRLLLSPMESVDGDVAPLPGS
jgi:hypothetical protein